MIKRILLSSFLLSRVSRFKDSFDAKPIFSEKFLIQKLNYIHYNPVTGKWNLAKDFVSYQHSSASFYEEGIAKYFIPKHYKDL